MRMLLGHAHIAFLNSGIAPVGRFYIHRRPSLGLPPPASALLLGCQHKLVHELVPSRQNEWVLLAPPHRAGLPRAEGSTALRPHARHPGHTLRVLPEFGKNHWNCCLACGICTALVACSISWGQWKSMTVQAVAGKTCIYTHDNNVGSHSLISSLPHLHMDNKSVLCLARHALPGLPAPGVHPRISSTRKQSISSKRISRRSAAPRSPAVSKPTQLIPAPPPRHFYVRARRARRPRSEGRHRVIIACYNYNTYRVP